MNMERKESLGVRALRAFDSPGLRLELKESGFLLVSWAKGKASFQVVVRSQLRPSTIPLLPIIKGNKVVITEYVTPGLAERLTQLGWNYLDGFGNVWLKAPGLHILVQGKKPTYKSRSAVQSAFAPQSLFTTLAILVRGNALNQRNLAAETGRSLGSTNRTCKALEELGYLNEDGGIERKATLVERWVESYLAVDWPEQRFISDRWTGADDVLNAQFEVLAPDPDRDGLRFGGELAAARLDDSLRPVTALLYCPTQDVKNLIKYGRLRSDPNGWIHVRSPLWKPPLVPYLQDLIVPLPLIYADLLALQDPRTTTTAHNLRKQWAK